jgi:amidase
MVRTVRDAAVVLGALAGTDPADPKTEPSDANRHEDYTQFLDADGMQGKRIGFYTGPMGNHFRVDTLMHEALDVFRENGAEIIELDEISERNIGGDAFQVLLYEFKDGLNGYFESLGEDAPLSSIEELADLTRQMPVEQSKFDRSLIIRAADMGSLEDEEYREAFESMLTGARDEGIDRVMDENELDAIIAPTGSPAWKIDLILGDNFSLSSSSPSARAGYPIITVPMGNIDGMPAGLSIFGRAWSEPVLLEIAYAYEQATLHRQVPKFMGWDGE